MDNFTFYSPTYFVFGKKTEEETGKYARQYGGKKVLIHFGGGSAIDSAKGIALGVPYSGDFWDFYKGKPVVEALPVGVVLTIAAAGSEGSTDSVVTNEDGMYKRCADGDVLRPKFAIMNPELTTTLPPYQTASGIADIMAHCMERLFSHTRDVEITDRLLEAILIAMIKEGRRVMADPENYEARANIMWTGMVAQNGLTGVGRQADWGTHHLENELSSKYGCSHGAGLAILFPAWMTYAMNRRLDRFVEFATRVWGFPMNFEHLMKAVPAAVERIAVLDRTKEPGSICEPLYQDICQAYYGLGKQMAVVGGRYGLSSKDTTPDFVACHNPSYVTKYDLLKHLKPGGVFLLNCQWSVEELAANLPADMKRALAEKKVQFHIINAIDIAKELGLGGRTNTILQAAFFKLVNLLPVADVAGYMKDAIKKTYGRKGEKIVEMNCAAVDRGFENLVKVDVPTARAGAKEQDSEKKNIPEFIEKIVNVMNRQEGGAIPVSAFVGMEDGTFPAGTAAYEYRMQLSPLDCTGCGSCATVCPAKTKALAMKPLSSQKTEEKNWDFAIAAVSIKQDVDVKKSVKNSQFAQPLFEFSGACAGCGETPYIKLITQLYGDRMYIANAK